MILDGWGLSKKREGNAIACGNTPNMDNYFRISPDGRDLNYNKYFVEGEQMISMGKDYTSENTTRLDTDQMVELLMGLEFIKQALAGDRNGAGL